jgi:hypothetical protein
MVATARSGEFIAELPGLSGSAKPKTVLAEAGAMPRILLSSFFAEGKNSDGVARLLAACKAHTRPVKPTDLGAIGESNMRARMLAEGADEETIQYKRKAAMGPNGLPFIIETAFAYRPEAEPIRRMVTGINWSAAIGDPFPRLGPFKSLSSILADQRAQRDEPKWAKQRRREKRRASAVYRRRESSGAEIDFLRTRRVELNAMTSRQLVDFIEAKLKEHGIKKIIPDDATIERHARRTIERHLTEKAVEKISKEVAAKAKAAKLPPDLRAQIEQTFEEKPGMSWDAVVARIMRGPQVEKGGQ